MLGEVSIRVVRLVNGGRSPFDGKWLAEYDPTVAGTEALGRLPGGSWILRRLSAHIVCTDDPAKALRFPDVRAAHAMWTATSGRTRPDGQPDRPLTAFSVSVEPAPEAAKEQP